MIASPPIYVPPAVILCWPSRSTSCSEEPGITHASPSPTHSRLRLAFGRRFEALFVADSMPSSRSPAKSVVARRLVVLFFCNGYSYSSGSLICLAYFGVALVSSVPICGYWGIDTRRRWFDCLCVDADRIAFFRPSFVPPIPFEQPQVTAADPRLGHFIVTRGEDMWLKMVLKDGFLHADLHPGNILVRAAEVGLTSCGAVHREGLECVLVNLQPRALQHMPVAHIPDFHGHSVTAKYLQGLWRGSSGSPQAII